LLLIADVPTTGRLSTEFTPAAPKGDCSLDVTGNRCARERNDALADPQRDPAFSANAGSFPSTPLCSGRCTDLNDAPTQQLAEKQPDSRPAHHQGSRSAGPKTVSMALLIQTSMRD